MRKNPRVFKKTEILVSFESHCGMVLEARTLHLGNFPNHRSKKPSIMTIFVLVVLSILGPILVLVGLNWFIKVICRHPYLLRIKGTVLTVEKKYDSTDDKVTFYPTIAYTAPEGNHVRFQSSSGSTQEVRRLSGPNVSPWRDGQSIDVFHDPSGVLKPCIASLWGLYGWSIGFIIGGTMLVMVVVNKWNHLGG